MKSSSYIIGAIAIALFSVLLIGMISAYSSDATGIVGEQIRPAPQTESKGAGEQIRPANQQSLPSDGNGDYHPSEGSSYSSSVYVPPAQSDTVKLKAVLNKTDLNTTSNAKGNASFALNKTSNKLSYNLTLSGLSSNETGAEIDFPGVIINSTTNQTLSSYQLPLGNMKTGVIYILDAVKNYVISNQALVKIKSLLFPGGEISGQIRLI